MATRCGRIGRSASSALLLARRRHRRAARLGLGLAAGASRTPPRPAPGASAAASAAAAGAIVEPEPLRPFRASSSAGSAGPRRTQTQRLAFFGGKAPSSSEDPEEKGEGASSGSEAEEEGAAPRAAEMGFVAGEDYFSEGSGGGSVGRADDDDAEEGIDRSEFTRGAKFRMPDLGDAGEEDGVVVKWHKKEGDIIGKGDAMCDVRTELFEFGVDSDDVEVTITGEILVPEGDDPAEPGEVLRVILREETGTKKGEEK